MIKLPLQSLSKGERHTRIIYERHYMEKYLKQVGFSDSHIALLERQQPKIVHSYIPSYSYGTES